MNPNQIGRYDLGAIEPAIAYYRDRAAQCWMADLSAAAGAEGTRHLFGTCELPTPYTLQATDDEVRRKLAARNPGHHIVRGNDR
jgi:hypothetical protein